MRKSEQGDGDGEEGQLGGERKGGKKRRGDKGQSQKHDHGPSVAATEFGEPRAHRNAAARKGAGGRTLMT